LDDPEMVLGRHRTVMIGDRVTGPIVSTTIQFVKPALLKAELNKQFRERFDGWEPPKRARKFIGAKVIQGNYVLIDPTEEFDEQSYERRRNRTGSATNSISTGSDGPKEKTIRMPPSLTLSKIRSLKNQVLHAAVKANLEIGTVALACVYFERLCLDCRVDKSNRRLAFAACLLLASKLNEPNVGLVMRHQEEAGSENDKPRRLQSLIRPNKTSNKMFASLLLFFTQDWSLSLNHIFTAEWGVFAALGFSLDATPLQIAFHFKRLMKTLEWSPLDYLGSTMYTHWQNALVDEEERRVKLERRRELKRKQNEERLLNLHIEIENEVMRRKTERQASDLSDARDESAMEDVEQFDPKAASGNPSFSPPKSPKKTTLPNERRLKLFNRFAARRSVSTDRLEDRGRQRQVSLAPSITAASMHVADIAPLTPHRRSGSLGRLVQSPSMPSISNVFSDPGIVAIDIPDDPNDSDTSSIGGMRSDDEGIKF
jgi:Cyclin, N-terminal domain